jgi:hypothetical protein
VIIHTIRELDINRVRDVLQGKATGRGCGKTIAKMMLMFAHGMRRVDKHWTHFLYVGENPTHTRDVQRTSLILLDEIGFNVGFDSKLNGSHEFGMFGNQIKTWYEGREVTFMFAPANEDLPCRIRGSRFDRAFVDLTWDTAARYGRALDEIRYHLV